jgi:hypothetical protein
MRHAIVLLPVLLAACGVGPRYTQAPINPRSVALYTSAYNAIPLPVTPADVARCRYEAVAATMNTWGVIYAAASEAHLREMCLNAAAETNAEFRAPARYGSSRG